MSATPPLPTRYETLSEVAARVGVCTRTLRRRIADGDLTAYRFDPKLIRIDPAQLDAVLSAIPRARPTPAASA